MAEASSKATNRRRPWLCRPAKASVLRRFQGTASMRQVRWCAGSTLAMAVAEISNQSAQTASRSHLVSSGQVLVLSCAAVLAVTTPRVSRNVASAHTMIHATNADLPTPCPEATAMRIASEAPARERPMSESTLRCHGSGPRVVRQHRTRLAPGEGEQHEAQRIVHIGADLERQGIEGGCLRGEAVRAVAH